MAVLEREVTVRGPWSLATSRRFWEGFAPGRLAGQQGETLTATFLGDADWRPVAMSAAQTDGGARVRVEGDGDLDAALAQVLRVLAIDVDGTGWPAVGARDPVVGAAQRALPGFRPCGFFSPYEAAAWTVLIQRVRIAQAAALKQRVQDRLGERGAFPAPAALRGADLGLPERNREYLDGVCEAALDGAFDADALRAVPAEEAIAAVQQVRGLGPFAAGLVVLRGANHPDGILPAEPRLEARIARDCGPDAGLATVSEAWRPFRTWAAVHLRATADS